MVQIIPRSPSFGSNWGEALNQSADTLAQYMMQEKVQNKKAAKFSDLLQKTKNYTKEEADLIANAPEMYGKELIKQKGAGPQQEFIKGIMNKHSGEGGQTASQVQPNSQAQDVSSAPQQPSAIDLMQQSSQVQSPKEDLSSQLSLLARQQRQDLMNRMMGPQQAQFGQPQMGPQMQGLQGLMGGMQGLPAAMNQDLMQRAAQYQYPEPQDQPQEVPQDPRDMGQVAPVAQATQPQSQQTQPQVQAQRQPSIQDIENDALALASMGTPETKAMAKTLNAKADRMVKANSKGEKEAEPIFKEAQAAQDSINLTQAQRKLDYEGGLDTQAVSTFANFLDEKIGAGAGNIFRSDATQLFKKLAAKRFPLIKVALGGVPRSAEMMDMFMKQYASETNSERARDMIYNYTEAEEQPKIFEARMVEEILDENNGNYPPNFKTALARRMRQRAPELQQEVEKILFQKRPSKEERQANASQANASQANASQANASQANASQAAAPQATSAPVAANTIQEGQIVYTRDGQARKKVNGIMVPA